ncbi:hypothetical protein GCM10009119_09700 [Algoriphagus jejuensis]|uniref:Uncharacterized protein n=1 Tax=Algoriphagus jejuensis TaxID=419934 RepID=A0ABN1MX33_9BACT
MKEKFIRFGISDGHGRRAATWKIWTPRSKSDIYLSCRELGIFKVSLHQSGSWHFGFISNSLDEYFDEEAPFLKSRHIKIWPRPKPFAAGTTLAFRIITPHTSVKTLIEPGTKNIKWISNCSPALATEIDIIITSYELDENSWPGKTQMGTRLIGSYKLSSSEFIWVVSWEVPVPDLSSLSRGKSTLCKGKSVADLKSTDLRAIVYGDSDDGSKFFIDCTVEVN